MAYAAYSSMRHQLINDTPLISLVSTSNIRVGFGNITGNYPMITISQIGGSTYGLTGYKTSPAGSKTRRDDRMFQVDIYYKDFTCGVGLNGTTNWTFVEADDIVGNYNSTVLNLSFFCDYTVPCTENWTLIPSSCLTNDSYFIAYYDANTCGTFNDLPVDNNSFGVCNFCSEDLDKVYLSECYLN